MKNPVLHIKKGVEQYVDPPPGSEEPNSREGPRGTRPVQRRVLRSPRRRGGFTYLPLLILALALVFFFRVVPRPPQNRATLAGWDTELRAMPYGEALLVSVTFIQSTRLGTDRSSPPAPRAAVRFLLPDTGAQLTLNDDLVRTPITLRGQMPYTAAVRKVQATVSIGAETRTLSLTARKMP